MKTHRTPRPQPPLTVEEELDALVQRAEAGDRDDPFVSMIDELLRQCAAELRSVEQTDDQKQDKQDRG